MDEILFYIALVDRKPATGDRVYYEIRDRVADYADNPLAGHIHPKAPRDWLYFKYKRWLVFYKSNSTGIEVMRVVDAVRDLPRQLRDS